MTEYEEKEALYERMCGLIDSSFTITPYDDPVVINEFEEGCYCYELYQNVYEASIRLNNRLDVQEDSDVELIINSMLDITHYLCGKMFDYAKRCAYQTFEQAEALKQRQTNP